jgi:DNA-binding HxlR family transcriptional regulator
MVDIAQDTTPQVCTRSLKLLGDFWTLNIIGALRDGQLRYCDLQRAAGGINPVTLSSRLRRLQQGGLIDRNASTDDISVTYKLTPLGEAALPVLDAVDAFSRRLPHQS